MFEVVEDAVVYLAQEHGVSVEMARTGEEALDYLHTVSRTLAESVYRKKAHELDCVSRRKMQQQTNDAGEGQFGNDESSSNLPGGKAKAEVIEYYNYLFY